MKTTLMTAALALLMTSGAAHAQEFTQQECEKVWSKENWALEYKKCKEADPQSSCRLFVEPPNYTCVRLTEPFLVGHSKERELNNRHVLGSVRRLLVIASGWGARRLWAWGLNMKRVFYSTAFLPIVLSGCATIQLSHPQKKPIVQLI